MSEPETITLPRSGLVLTKNSAKTYELVGVATLDEFSDGCLAWFTGDAPLNCTREAGIAYLDARAMRLRALLLPPDARERVARAIWYSVLRDRYGESDAWEDVPDCKKDDALDRADAVLAALGIGGGR